MSFAYTENHKQRKFSGLTNSLLDFSSPKLMFVSLNMLFSVRQSVQESG